MNNQDIFRKQVGSFLLFPVMTMVVFLGALQSSQAQNYEGKRITAVDVRYEGPRTVDEAKIRSHMSVKPGQLYSNTKLDEDVRRLYESGLVEDVSFFAERHAGGVKLTARVKTSNRFTGVGFRGNKRFKSKKLAATAKLNAQGSISDLDILNARRNIEKLYLKDGYPDVRVTHRKRPLSQRGQSELIFYIFEGNRSFASKISFRGNRAFPDHVLRKKMTTKTKGIFSFITKSGYINNEQLDHDQEQLIEHYKNHGYMSAYANIKRKMVSNNRVELLVNIHEGRKYEVGRVSFGPISVFKPSQLRSVLTLTPGQAYSAEKMKKDIRTIRSYYGSRGYADVKIEPKVGEISPKVVSLTYMITEGVKSRVGKITIQGNDRTQDRVIRRELPLRPGDYLNSVGLETARRRLRNMNYFDAVQISTTDSSRPGYRDINLYVTEKKTGSISFGMGFSSAENIVGYVNLEQRNFSITNWPTFTGGGQRFSTSIQVGPSRSDYRLSWVEPWLFGKKLALGVDLFYRDSLYYSTEYEQSQYGGAIYLRKPIAKRTYLRGEYRLEKITIDVDDDTPLTSGFIVEDGEYVRSALSLSLVYDSRDSNLLPREGEKINIGATYAGGILGGDVNIINTNIAFSKYWNTWGDGIFSIRGAASVSDTHDHADRVPVFDRRSLGGPHNLRGFDNRDIGPRDSATNESLGGNSSFYASAEFSYPLFERVRGVIFYDVGQVNTDSWDFSGRLYDDAGFGLRLYLPMGPLAIDYAIPINSPDPKADRGGQFQFYLDYKF